METDRLGALLPCSDGVCRIISSEPEKFVNLITVKCCSAEGVILRQKTVGSTEEYLFKVL